MTFATKKEADAYDKMLDIADRLFDFLGDSQLGLDEDRQEELCLLLAEKRDQVMPILRGIAPKKKASSDKPVPAKTTAKASAKRPAKPAAEPRARKPVKKAAKPRMAADKK